MSLNNLKVVIIFFSEIRVNVEAKSQCISLRTSIYLSTKAITLELKHLFSVKGTWMSIA